jgi:hypothetical protein
VAAAGALGVLGVVLGVGVVGLVLCVGVLGLFYALLTPAIGKAKAAAGKSQSNNNMKQIILALHNYHDTQMSFPPAYVTDANGKPLYSWRVLILPYMERGDLYDQFDKTKSWDDPANAAISEMMIEEFRSPSDPNVSESGASYFCLVGANTMLPPDKGRKIAEVRDGLSNTIILLELKDVPGSWAAPIDPHIDQVQPVVGDGANQLHPAQGDGILVGLADGSVRYVAGPSLGRVVQPPAFTINDGMALPPE